MARLNEPPVMADSYDILRRKFLRQNRDIARVNSNQSLRIRGLENECARLLSENLELRGQIMRLEKEVDDNGPRRIADHALQVKAKMEAQLIELGSLLASFGLEPPTKKQSPTAGRQNSRSPRLSLAMETSSSTERSSPELSPDEAESLAEKEGRLPPIYESKTYPRRTLNREEILALCASDVDATDSPELGPPPVSRLFRDALRKSEGSPSKTPASSVELAPAAVKGKTADSVSKPSSDDVSETTTPAHNLPTAAKPASSTGSQLVGTERRLPLRGKEVSKASMEASAAAEPPTAVLATAKAIAATPAPRAGSKRKFAINDENMAVAGVKAVGNDKIVASRKGKSENSIPMRELKNPRSIRDLASSRKEQHEESTGTKGVSGGRKPLSLKSTNEDISSPRKRANDEALGSKNGSASGKPPSKSSRTRERPKMIEVPNPPPPAVVDVDVDHGKADGPATVPVVDEKPVNLGKTVPSSSELETSTACPSTPPSSSTLHASERPYTARHETRDTPPPADISSQGEMPRPSRRARASVSYAEPNLRDKMRRPTKELFDAVAGEGRYLQRQQLQHQLHDLEHSHLEDAKHHAQPVTPTVAAHDGLVDTTSAQHTANLSTDQQPEADQTAHRHAAAHSRRKRASSAQPHDPKPAGATAAAKKADPCSLNNEPDPYEFTLSSSPPEPLSGDASTTTKEGDETVSGGHRKGGSSAGSRKSVSSSRSSSRVTRRSSAAEPNDDSFCSSAADRHTKPSAARKRTSMVGPRKGSMLDNEEEEDDDPADSSYEPPSGGAEKFDGSSETHTISTRDRISRRRSMML